MARNLAILADRYLALYLDKSSDPGPGSNCAPVQVHQGRLMDDYVLTERHICRYHSCRLFLKKGIALVEALERPNARTVESSILSR